MQTKIFLEKSEKFAKDILSGESTGHDWWHALRVKKIAKKIQKKEGGDIFIIEMSAILHDIADRKINKNIDDGLNKIRKFLDSIDLDKKAIDEIVFIIKYVSYSSKKIKTKNINLKILQDADRLDALGAIGIARVFAYGGKYNKEIFNPNIKPNLSMTKNQYKKNIGTSFNHFYEKILNLKNMMNTKEGRRLAEERHLFVKEFLREFFLEWNCKK